MTFKQRRLAPEHRLWRGTSPLCRRWAVPGALLSVAAVLFVGCSKQDENRQVLYGRVTYDGQQVTGGDIFFVPIGGTQGPTTGAAVTNGKYRADHGGGVPMGKHQVRIRGFLGEMPPTPQGGPDNVTYPTVPNEYYTDSKIEVDVVPGATQGEKNFDLLPGMKLNVRESP